MKSPAFDISVAKVYEKVPLRLLFFFCFQVGKVFFRTQRILFGMHFDHKDIRIFHKTLA